MHAETADIPDPRGTGGFDAISAVSQMMDATEGILTITGACANLRSRMILEQGWSEDFATSFSQNLALGLVNQALAPDQDWRSILERL